ncbi:spore coat protein [Caldifermentibacillus hisashii]|uniref:spore coat protein n=1 Tax=Caldifermentibacillus hisashii TaxID=996558 RepID=UPI002E21B60F|nr:spore coat protein [Caldifermentibacillus hisashii]
MYKDYLETISGPKPRARSKQFNRNINQYFSHPIIHKEIASSYSTALKEASHGSLYRTIASISQETEDCHRNLYNLMFKNGWYALEKETPQTIQQSVQQFSNYMQSQDPYRGNLIQ